MLGGPSLLCTPPPPSPTVGRQDVALVGGEHEVGGTEAHHLVLGDARGADQPVAGAHNLGWGVGWSGGLVGWAQAAGHPRLRPASPPRPGAQLGIQQETDGVPCASNLMEQAGHLGGVRVGQVVNGVGGDLCRHNMGQARRVGRPSQLAGGQMRRLTCKRAAPRALGS